MARGHRLIGTGTPAKRDPDGTADLGKDQIAVELDAATGIITKYDALGRIVIDIDIAVEDIRRTPFPAKYPPPCMLIVSAE